MLTAMITCLNAEATMLFILNVHVTVYITKTLSDISELLLACQSDSFTPYKLTSDNVCA